METIGGAEKVALTMARELNADIFTTCVNETAVLNMGFKNIRIKTIGPVPSNPPFRQQAILARFRAIKCSGRYDYFIIDGDWAVSAAILNKPNLWYAHSPIRELWDLYDYNRIHYVRAWKRPAYDAWVHVNRFLTKGYLRHVNTIVCNSLTTEKRIKNYLDMDCIVIYPPIETTAFRCNESEGYWLSVNRLVEHKRVDLQIKAFAALPDEKLVIVGGVENSASSLAYYRYLNSIKPVNVVFLDGVNSAELIDLYARCKGFVATARDEDFGMTPVEAMASGKPVVAPDEGGYRESVIDGITGRLVRDIREDTLIDALREISGSAGDFRTSCINQAKTFDTTVFIRKLMQEIGN